MDHLKSIVLLDFPLADHLKTDLKISYELFGKPLHTAPVLLVNHALTGNSHVAGTDGWWQQIIGEKKVVDTSKYTVLCFNIPGNGYDGTLFSDVELFTAEIVSRIFLKALEILQIPKLYAIMGGSLGGSIAWQMATIKPNIAEHIIPIGCHWHASDWLLATCHIQDLILQHSKRPLEDARIHAMLTYRTPQSFSVKFNRTKNPHNDTFQIISWLEHHGEKLKNRFYLNAYKLMNQLLKSIDVAEDERKLAVIQAQIHLIGIDTDLLFSAHDIKKTYKALKPLKKDIYYHEIQSIHGHDAFLIEYEQMKKILQNIF